MINSDLNIQEEETWVKNTTLIRVEVENENDSHSGRDLYNKISRNKEYIDFAYLDLDERVGENAKKINDVRKKWVKTNDELARQTVIINKLRDNIEILINIQELEDDWNGEGAAKFDKDLILKCIQLVNSKDLKHQPEIFPTGRDSIQFEYEKENGDYLEFEIYSDHISGMRMNADKTTNYDELSPKQMYGMINEFFS